MNYKRASIMAIFIFINGNKYYEILNILHIMMRALNILELIYNINIFISSSEKWSTLQCNGYGGGGGYFPLTSHI